MLKICWSTRGTPETTGTSWHRRIILGDGRLRNSQTDMDKNFIEIFIKAYQEEIMDLIEIYDYEGKLNPERRAKKEILEELIKKYNLKYKNKGN